MSNGSMENNHCWLHRFAVLAAISTFLLLGAGGLVTSHGVGMSVPDWPNSYGYNMFLFPPSKWVGGIFYEHTHRLWASVVGLMTTILAIWIWRKDSRQWMKWLGVGAFIMVVIQGVLGGLRVRLDNADLGGVHGVVGQSYFVLMCSIVLFTSGFWRRISEQKANVPGHLRVLVLVATLLIFCQLILGASMRAEHAGLSISDFPLAHGQVWPDTSPDAIQRYNAERIEIMSGNPITAFAVILQMVHRIGALLVFLCVATSAGLALGKLGRHDPLAKFALFWLGLITAQIGLGIWTVLSNKAADVATLHLLVGALSLLTGALWCLIAFRRSMRVPVTQNETFGAFGNLAK